MRNETLEEVDAKIDSEIRTWKMLPQGSIVVVGISGGADSVALTDFLFRFRELYGVSLLAAHINHGLRGEESDADEQFVRSFCEKRGIPLRVLHANVRGLARKQGQGLEECGREVRYSFFRELCGGKDRIATAHTLSDSAETVLMNLAKGAGPKGLSGIPPVRGNIIRPLLAITRSEVEQYCTLRGLSYVTDSSNHSDAFGRNKLRLYAVPVLKKINPAFEQAVRRTSEILQCDEEYLYGAARRCLAGTILPDGGCCTGALCRLPRPILLRTIALIMEKAGASRLSFNNLKAAELLIHREEGAITVTGGIRCTVSGGVFRAERLKKNKPVTEWSVPLSPDGTALPSGRMLFLHPVPDGYLKIHGEINKLLFNNLISYDTIASKGCTVRNRRAGDAYRPVGRGVTKTLKQLFSENKISPSERDCKAVFVCGEEIVWAEDFGVSEKYRARQDSKNIYQISIKECGQTVHSMQDDIKSILYSEEALKKIVNELGTKISEDYREKNLLLVSVLKGSVVFMADLMRAITIPCSIDFMSVSSYGCGTKTSGVVKITKDLDIDLKGYDVLVVEDILDSGLTLSYLLKLLKSRSPKSIRLCTLFDKPGRRTAKIRADYVGTVVPDEFIVGYGLDYAQKYRNLPYVGILKPEVYGG